MMYSRIRKDKLLYIFSKQQIPKGTGKLSNYRRASETIKEAASVHLSRDRVRKVAARPV